MVDITRLRKNSEKKTISLSAAEISFKDVLTTDLHELFKLPSDALIINAGVVVEAAGQGGLTVDFGFDGGTELGAAVAVNTTGYKQTSHSITSLTLVEGAPNTLGSGLVQPRPRILTGTGKLVTAKFSSKPTAGLFHFLVEYAEYKLGSGELTNFGSNN